MAFGRWGYFFYGAFVLGCSAVLCRKHRNGGWSLESSGTKTSGRYVSALVPLVVLVFCRRSVDRTVRNSGCRPRCRADRSSPAHNRYLPCLSGSAGVAENGQIVDPTHTTITQVRPPFWYLIYGLRITLVLHQCDSRRPRLDSQSQLWFTIEVAFKCRPRLAHFDPGGNMQRDKVPNTNGRGVEDVSLAINDRRERRAREAVVKHDLMFSATLLCFGLAGSLMAQAPQMNAVQPDAGKVGAVLRVHGVYLGKAKVDEVYLSDHTFDMKVKVLDQKDDMIEFRIPPFAKPGRLQMVVKTTSKQPLILEQPVYVTVEEPMDQHGIINSRDLSDIRVKPPSVPMVPLANGSLIVDHLATQTRTADPPPLSAGRLIWTGALRKNALLSFSPAGASSGILNGRLPGAPVKISVQPAELVDGGIEVYSKNRERSATSELPSAWNGWNVVVHDWDPRRADVNVVEAPSPANDWKSLVLRNGNRNVSVPVVEWQSAAAQ